MQIEHFLLLLIHIKSVHLAKHKIAFIVKKPQQRNVSFTVVRYHDIHQNCTNQTRQFGHFLTVGQFKIFQGLNGTRRSSHSGMPDEELRDLQNANLKLLNKGTKFTVPCCCVETTHAARSMMSNPVAHGIMEKDCVLTDSFIKTIQICYVVKSYVRSSSVVFMKK